MSAKATYAQLVEKGCLCGGESPSGPFECPVHGPGDMRGIRAFFKAGMPGGFPMPATCAICKSDGLMYPNVELDDAGKEAKHEGYKPTLICPQCSVPTCERAIRAEVVASGLHELGERRVFA